MIRQFFVAITIVCLSVITFSLSFSSPAIAEKQYSQEKQFTQEKQFAQEKQFSQEKQNKEATADTEKS